MQPPTFRDILAAQKRLRPYLPRTPLHTYPAINALIGTEVFIKHENYQPVGAFKVRGGIHLTSQLSAEESRHGIIAASTDNKVGIDCSGGNVSRNHLREALREV